MPYRESIFFRNTYLHIYCRGNEKRDIFLDAVDYKRFLAKMKEYKVVHNVSIICYCLMSNHFHLILKQNTNEPISSFIHRLTVSYSMYFNKRYNRVGHLFQGRFKAKIIRNDDYLLHLSRYIHLNPLKIYNSALGLESYLWSSYPEYLHRTTEGICEKEIILEQFSNVYSLQEYKRFVVGVIPGNDIVKIKSLIIEDE